MTTSVFATNIIRFSTCDPQNFCEKYYFIQFFLNFVRETPLPKYIHRWNWNATIHWIYQELTKQWSWCFLISISNLSAIQYLSGKRNNFWAKLINRAARFDTSKCRTFFPKPIQAKNKAQNTTHTLFIISSKTLKSAGVGSKNNENHESWFTIYQVDFSFLACFPGIFLHIFWAHFKNNKQLFCPVEMLKPDHQAEQSNAQQSGKISDVLQP